ncbi:MAG: hypothetical protein LBD16_06480 [Oscillospiraceae bacterium]|jgi:ABC-2 type transport system permease protein|nr:hypothetical protein [Oscillospiraceae bacterium]
MRDYFIVLRQQIRQRLGLSLIRANFKKGARARTTMIAVAVAVAAVSVLGMLYTGEFFLSRFMAEQKMSYVTLFVGLALTLLTTFVSGTALLLSVLYFSRDSEALAVLPVRPSTVFAAKTTVAYLGEIGVSALIILPLLAFVGVFERCGVGYYVKSLVVWLTITTLPLTLSALASLPLMRFTALWKHRDIVAVVGGLLLVALFILGETYLSSRLAVTLEENPAQIVMLLFGNTKLFETIAKAIPPLYFALSALTLSNAQSWLNLLALICVSLALLAVTLYISRKLYRQGAMSQLETHKSAHRSRKGGRISARSPILAVAMKDLKILFRTPVYALNTLAVIIMLPILMLVPMASQSMMTDPDIQGIMNVLGGLSDTFTLALIYGGIAALFSGLNSAISTAVSREGKQFFWVKVLPVPYSTQIYAKLLSNSVFSAATIIMCVIIAAVSIHLSAAIIALGTLLAIVLCIAISTIQLTIDAIRPKLTWSNPTEAIKQNANTLYGMLAAAVLLIALGGIAYLLLHLNMRGFVVFIEIFLLSAIAAVSSLIWMKKAARKAFYRIEA